MPPVATLASAAPAERVGRRPTQLDVSPSIFSHEIKANWPTATRSRPPLQTGVRLTSVRTHYAATFVYCYLAIPSSALSRLADSIPLADSRLRTPRPPPSSSVAYMLMLIELGLTGLVDF